MVLLEEFDRRKPWAGEGISSTAHWLNVKCGVDMNSAHEKVRVARALVGLPKVAAAFARGALSYSKVRAITRVATAANEEYLVGAARFGTAQHLEKLVRLYRRCERDRENRAAAESHAARAFRFWKKVDGSICFEGRLAPGEGAVFLKAFEAAVDSLREAEFAAAKSEGAPAVKSSANGADARDRVPPNTGSAAREFAAANSARVARNADALMVLAETMLAHGPAAVEGGDRYELSVHVSEDSLRADGDGPAPELADGTALAPETVRRMACDCSRVCVHEDEHGEILSVGGGRGRFPRRSGERSERAIGNVRFRGVETVGSWMRITSGIGRTVGRPSFRTSYCCAGGIMCWCTRGDGRSRRRRLGLGSFGRMGCG